MRCEVTILSFVLTILAISVFYPEFMPVIVQTEELLNLNSSLPMLDVRSEGEYAQGHIPGAINMPLFNNEERAIVGTLYKQTGQDAALEKGLVENVNGLIRQYVPKKNQFFSNHSGAYSYDRRPTQ